jgi:predicted MFS family arabinose efflux permease
VPENASTSGLNPKPRRPAILAAGLLLAALALVVLYTSRRAFLSPAALVVVAAIGVAALLLQIRLRPDLPSSIQASSTRTRLLLNGIGVAFAVGAVFGDLFHLNPAFMLIAALAAVVAFAVSGIIVLSALRKPRA